jgi:hypothetical protein
VIQKDDVMLEQTVSPTQSQLSAGLRSSAKALVRSQSELRNRCTCNRLVIGVERHEQRSLKNENPSGRILTFELRLNIQSIN